MKNTITFKTAQGRRNYQEDRVVVQKMSEGYLLAVFDGHGGDSVSDFARVNFPSIFVNALRRKAPTSALIESFFELNSRTQGDYAGSTASVAFIPNSLDKAYTAVLGDSPILIKDVAGSIWHGPDHNVRSNAAEAAAAVARGGTIYGGYLSVSYHGGGLQMARALGDASLHKVLDRNPEVTTIPLGPGSFVLVATDGVFDPSHKNVKQAADDIVGLIDAGLEANNIVDRALAIPTMDNASAILMRIEA